MTIYTVRQGDTVDSIAASQNIPVELLIWENQIEYPYRLAVGQSLFLSDAGMNGIPAETASRPPLYSFGYAYPFINADTLADTLPFLTDLYVFSYGFTAEGNLVFPMTDDGWMITAARNAGVRPVLTLTPLGADGRFNNNLVSVLVQNQDIQQRLIWELGRTMQERGFLGLDIDFEYILARQYTGNSLKSLDLSGKGKASQFCFRPGLDHLKCVENNEKNMQMGSLVANILI